MFVIIKSDIQQLKQLVNDQHHLIMKYRSLQHIKTLECKLLVAIKKPMNEGIINFKI